MDDAVVLLLSDGTGSTATRVLDAALRQFQGPDVRVVRCGGLRTAADVDRALSVDPPPALVAHTLASSELRRHACEAIAERRLADVDLFGPLLVALSALLHTDPSTSPGLLHELESESLRRADAMDFAIAHDDGLRLAELDQAEVVIAGVSRVSKSVTCYALAFHGTRAANVPLAADLPPPEELLRLDPRRVVALTMGAARLRMIRETRAAGMGYGPLVDYVDDRRIVADLRFAHALAARHGWHVVDVTHRAVEETAREVLRLVRRR